MYTYYVKGTYNGRYYPVHRPVQTLWRCTSFPMYFVAEIFSKWDAHNGKYGDS